MAKRNKYKPKPELSGVKYKVFDYWVFKRQDLLKLKGSKLFTKAQITEAMSVPNKTANFIRDISRYTIHTMMGQHDVSDIIREMELNQTCFGCDQRWREAGKPVMFVRPEVLELIKNSTFDINMNEIRLPEGRKSLCISLPDGTSYLLNEFTPKIENAKTYIQYIDSEIVRTFPTEGALEHLKEWPQHIVEHAGRVNIIETAIKLLVYMNAFENCMKPGLPDINKYELNLLRGVKGTVLQLPKGMREVHSAFLRRGHFRTLRHVKYRRKPDGTMRMVYVKPTVVNGPVDPNMIINPNNPHRVRK